MIKKIFRKIKYDILDGYATKSYSQEGEDMILKRVFENKKDGFYVDVGAHHPKRFSNTYIFYKMGWRGINIDAMPGSMKSFNDVRPRDINIEQPISDKKEVLTYYVFNEKALNGFSKELSKSRDCKGNYKILYTKDIETSPLADVLSDKLPRNQEIDFLSIDVEGLDFKVLKSNDFEKYRPKMILIELLESSYESLEKNSITQYLRELDYKIYAKSVNTVFFIDKTFCEDRFSK